MARVLVCTNDSTFTPSLYHAYRARGDDVVVGVSNLDPKIGRFDVVHLHWPEELVQYQLDEYSANRVLNLLDWWRQRAVLVASVHNLVPHEEDEIGGPWATFFRQFYERVHLLCHFSEYSRRRFKEVYPSLQKIKNVIYPLNRYDHLRPLSTGRENARRALGLPDNAPVFAVCGTLRKFEEISLIRKAWRRFDRPDARLLFAARAPAGKRYLRRAADMLVQRLWERDSRVLRFGPYANDELLVRLVEAADAMLVPRLGHHLNSGLIPLAFTFGTPVVAPDSGANREIVPLPMNELYDMGDPGSLVAAMKRQLRKGPSACQDVLRHAEGLGWGKMLDVIWPHVIELSRERPSGEASSGPVC